MFLVLLLAAVVARSSVHTEVTVKRPLAELGVAPSTCAAAGLSPGDAAALLGRAESFGAAMVKAKALAVDAALAELSRVEAAMLTSPGDDALQAQLESARSACSQAKVALAEAREAMWEAAMQELSLPQRAALLNARASNTFRLCAHYRVTELRSAQRGQLSIARDCDGSVAALPAKVVQFAAEVEGRADVIAAKQHIAANLEGVRQAFASHAGAK
ncbi:MAG: hypothetical protein AMXMBFR58_11390 [Phycisphaerae bacterium]